MLKVFECILYSPQALGCTVRHCTATVIDDTLPSLAQRVSDSTPSVRSCLVDVLADWLLHQPDRYSTVQYKSDTKYMHLCFDRAYASNVLSEA